MIPAVAPIVSPTARSSSLLTPSIPLHYPWRDSPSTLSSIPQSPMSLDITPIPISVAIQRTHDGPASNLPFPNVLKDDYFVARTRLQPIQGNPSDDFSGWSGPIKQEPPTPSTPSGIMGRLKNFGKLTKKPANDTVNISTPESTATAVVGTPALLSGNEVKRKTAVQQLLTSPINPPTTNDAPLHLFPPNTIVLISEEASPSFTTIYRGTVLTTHNDIDALEKGILMWLAEFLLLNQTPPSAPLAKLSFTSFKLPCIYKNPDVEPLPELLNFPI